MSTASTATLEPKTELEGSGARKASALRVLRMLQTAIGPTIAGLLRVLTTGSGASRDFGPAKTSWRIEAPQAAKQKCLISSRFPSLTRVPLSASAPERRLLSADAPEPPRLLGVRFEHLAVQACHLTRFRRRRPEIFREAIAVVRQALIVSVWV